MPNPHCDPFPRKSRSHHFRLPLGAVCCVFIWFLWLFSRNTPPPPLSTPLQSSVSCDVPADYADNLEKGNIKIFDFREYAAFTPEVKKEVHGAMRYFSVHSKKCKGTASCARFFLPTDTRYQDFMGLAQLAYDEGLGLKMEKESVLVGNE